MMLDRHEFDLLRFDPDLLQHGEDARDIAPVTPVAVEHGDQRTVGRVEMPERVVPTRRAENADRRKRIGDCLYITGLQAGLLETEERGLFRLFALCVFLAQE